MKAPPEDAGSSPVCEDGQAGRGDNSPDPVKPLDGPPRCKKKRGMTSRRVGWAAGVLAVHSSSWWQGEQGQLLPWAGRVGSAGRAGRRHSLAKARVKDFPVGIQLLILPQIGSLVCNKGAKFPFKNPAGIWLQTFSHRLPHNCEEYQV